MNVLLIPVTRMQRASTQTGPMFARVDKVSLEMAQFVKVVCVIVLFSIVFCVIFSTRAQTIFKAILGFVSKIS